MNYSELNPSINYNKPQPMNSLTNSTYEDTNSFSKSQNNMPNKINCKNQSNIIANKHLHIEQSSLAKIYYSPENVDRIQKQIRREIFRRTNGKFKVFRDADDLDMQVVMDGIFDEHAKHLPNQIIRQVKNLNKHTVNLVVPGAITQIDQTSKYLKQLDKPIEPMNRPIDANNGGRRTLPSFTSVLGF